MDIQMPQLDGIEATRFITGRHPDVRVVMLTMNEDDETVLGAIRAGASGYLLKGSGAEEVQTAIRAAAAGGMVFGAALAGAGRDVLRRSGPGPAAEEPFPDLTDRERAVLDLLAAGRSNDAIAAELYVSYKTVRNAVSVDLRQAARGRPRRGDHQGARGRATGGVEPARPGRTART